MSEPSPRKLAVILHADVVSSTALVRRDEALAHERIRDVFRRFSEAIDRYGGVALEVRGDALVAEFARGSDAVSASLSFQEENARFNATLDDDVRPHLRIGIAMGEVVVADSTITGDGVILAQRLEQIAQPGGVCIHDAAYQTLPKRLPFDYANIGEQTLKGFDDPVRAYAVTSKSGLSAPAPEPRIPATPSIAGSRATAGAVVAASILIVGGLAWWQPWMPADPPSPSARVVAPLRDKPSIAVLPFTNMSNDEEQEYFSDGLTDDLITDLSRISGLLVIARHSTFAYKDRPADLQQVGRELGVRYVLEGSVRKASDRVRINAQLIDTSSGTHVWAQRYDGDLRDVFALQDEVTSMIVDALSVSLTRDERVRLEAAAAVDPDAYDALLRGVERLQLYTPEDVLAARSFYEQAIVLDPGYARAHANLAHTYATFVLFGWAEDEAEDIRIGIEVAERALALDDRIPQIHFSLANLYGAEGRPESAKLAARRAIEVDPNYADGFGVLAQSLMFTGELEEALTAIDTGMRLNPHHSYMYLWVKGQILFHRERYEQAAEILEAAVERNPSYDQVRMMLAATYAQMGRLDDARWEAEELLALRPGFTVSGEESPLKYKRGEDQARLSGALRKAGLPQ